jgi:hypothetical protein
MTIGTEKLSFAQIVMESIKGPDDKYKFSMNNISFMNDRLQTIGEELDEELEKSDEQITKDCNQNEGLKCITPGNDALSMVMQLLAGNMALKHFFINGQFDDKQEVCKMMKSFYT